MSPGVLAESLDLGKLPSGPRVLSRLSSMVRNPDVQISDVADLFRSDPGLSARVVAACNSPFYSRGGEPTVDVRDAVMRLGISEVSRIVQIVALTDLKKYPTHLYTDAASHFWERSLHTAFVVDEISERDPMCYTAGIMHLVGIWVLCSVFPPGGRQTIKDRELAMQAQLEQLRLGVSFTEAGAAALGKWGFAESICNAVLWQLAPSAANSEEDANIARMLCRGVAIADWNYGAQNEKTLIRSDLTIEDINACNHRAAIKVANIGFGF